jgi:nuclear pore complex protein Nup107
MQRERCLELADRAGLNVNAITKRVVELVRASPGLASAAQLCELPLADKSGAITAEEEVSIRAIEWLTFDPDQRIDALIHTNALARKFVGTQPSRVAILTCLLFLYPNWSSHVTCSFLRPRSCGQIWGTR